MYLGQTAKGLVALLIGIVLATATAGVAAPVIWIIAAVDAYKIGTKLKDGQAVGKWEWF